MENENKEEAVLQCSETVEEIRPLKRSNAILGELIFASKAAKFNSNPDRKNTCAVEILMHDKNVDLIIKELKNLPEAAREEKLHEKLKKIQTRILEMQDDSVCSSFKKNVIDLKAIKDKIEPYLKDETNEVLNQESNSFG